MPAASRQAPAGLGELPEDLLLDLLGRLTIMERFSAAALVCKRWHQLCHAPQLLRSLHVEINSHTNPNPQRCFPRVQSLRRFLAGHGRHVRSLRLNAANLHPYLDWNPAAESYDGPPAAMEERQALAACLQCCTEVEELTLDDSTLPMGVGTQLAADWLLAMPRLRRLNHLGDSRQRLRLPPSLSSLTRLEHADLEGEGLQLPSLPPSLTSLQLLDWEADELPEQLTPLTRLQRLDHNLYEWIGTYDGSVSCTRLQQLSLLTHLCLYECGTLPASCLECLPCLRQLAVQPSLAAVVEEHQQLEHILGGCQQVTLLALTLQYDESYHGPNAPDDLVLRIPHSIAQLRVHLCLDLSAMAA